MAAGAFGKEDGFTGLELVILLVLLVAGVVLVLVIMTGSGGPAWMRTFPGGVVAESMYMTGDHIQAVGNVYGFPATSREAGTPPVVVAHEDPSRLGALRFTVSLFIGSTGAIDMDRLTIRWNSSGTPETLARVPSGTLVCPNWTISGKYNLLPGRTADADNLLEPGERFEITLCPIQGAVPYQKISVMLGPDGSAMPFTIVRTVPARIQPVMNLG